MGHQVYPETVLVAHSECEERAQLGEFWEGGGRRFGAKQTRGEGRLDMRSSAVIMKKELNLVS